MIFWTIILSLILPLIGFLIRRGPFFETIGYGFIGNFPYFLFFCFVYYISRADLRNKILPGIVLLYVGISLYGNLSKGDLMNTGSAFLYVGIIFIGIIWVISGLAISFIRDYSKNKNNLK